jgi:hypothetical protein
MNICLNVKNADIHNSNGQEVVHLVKSGEPLKKRKIPQEKLES